MNDAQFEVLVVLDPGTGEEQFMSRIDPRISVIHRLPPRLLVLLHPAGAPALSETPGGSCYTSGLPTSALIDLTPDQQLFAEAWALSRTPGQRHGNRLHWDTPGYQPPDPPQRPGRQ